MSCEEPAPTARYYVPINLLIDLGLRALSPAMPERIPAGSYGDQMPTIAFGTHPETGKLFIQGDLNAGGTGARPAADGESGLIIFAGSTARNNPVEVVESRLPSMRIVKYGASAGLRRRRTLSRRARHRARLPARRAGLHHLQPRAQGDAALGPRRRARTARSTASRSTSPDGAMRAVRKATQHPIAAGELVRILTGGGGGYGPPAAREREAVVRDVKEGYVSAEAARRDYGVSVSEPGWGA